MPPSKRVKIEEAFQLSEQQKQLIREDTANKKLWDEAMGNLKEGPVRISDSNMFPVFPKHAAGELTQWHGPMKMKPRSCCPAEITFSQIILFASWRRVCQCVCVCLIDSGCKLMTRPDSGWLVPTNHRHRWGFVVHLVVTSRY